MSVLKGSVFVGFILFALVPLSYGACWLDILKKDATHCQDPRDKTWHPVGSSWTNSRCDNCQCDRHEMSCCQGLPTNVKVPDDCTVEYDYDKCTIDVFKKDDRSTPCPHPYSAVLK